MRLCGIDPGLKGALAFVDLSDDGKEIQGLEVFDMPTVDFVDGRPVPDPRALRQLMDEFQPSLVLLEHVEARPKSGAASEWRFASGFGATLAVCQTFSQDARVHLVRPRLWKDKLGLSSDKSQSLSMAREIFPDAVELLARQKDDGRAEALLLVEYARKLLDLKAVEVI